MGAGVELVKALHRFDKSSPFKVELFGEADKAGERRILFLFAFLGHHDAFAIIDDVDNEAVSLCGRADSIATCGGVGQSFDCVWQDAEAPTNHLAEECPAFGRSKQENATDVGDIEAFGGDLDVAEDLGFARAEPAHNRGSLVGFHSAVDVLGGESFVLEHLRNRLRVFDTGAEDDGFAILGDLGPVLEGGAVPRLGIDGVLEGFGAVVAVDDANFAKIYAGGDSVASEVGEPAVSNGFL